MSNYNWVYRFAEIARDHQQYKRIPGVLRQAGLAGVIHV